MTKGEGKSEVIDLKGLLARDEDFVRAAVEALVQAALEVEMSEAIGAAKGERTETRLAYRSGYYSRSLITRVGTLELRVPQDRMGRFSTELFERYQRSEKALVGTLAEMYVQGVSTRKVKAVTEALCGHSFSASAISTINKSLDDGLKAFAERRLSESYPYLILDARYEKVREAGVIVSQAVLVVVAVDEDGRRQMPPEPPRDDPIETLDRRGRALLETLHGDRSYSGYASPDSATTQALYPVAIQYGYGEIWDRPGLDRRQRALVAVAAFTALRLDAQAAKFGQSALNVGLSRTDVIETVIQTGPYSGVAPALNALAALSQARR